MAIDVFISHSSKDRKTADAVCGVLESRGIRCWIAPRDIIAGTEWSEAIIDAISGARIMVLVFSSDANASPQVRREVQSAFEKGVTVIPLRVEDVPPAKGLEYYIRSVHWLDALTPPMEGHLEQLAEDVRALLSTGTQTDSSAADPWRNRSTSGDKRLSDPRRGRRLIVAGAAALVCLVAVILMTASARHNRDAPTIGKASQSGVRIAAVDSSSVKEAYHLLVSNRLPEAERLAREAVSRNDKDALAHAVLGSALLEQGITSGNKETAKEGFEHARLANDLDNTCALASVGLATWHVVDGDYGAAKRKLTEALARDPRMGYAYNQLGWISLQTGDLNGARSAFEKAIDLDPGLGWTKANLAEVYRRQNRLAEAERAARASIDLYPDRPGGYLELGAVLESEGKPGEAEQTYRKGLEKDGASANLHAFLAVNLAHRKNLPDARREADEAKRLGYPKDDPAFRRYGL